MSEFDLLKARIDDMEKDKERLSARVEAGFKANEDQHEEIKRKVGRIHDWMQQQHGAAKVKAALRMIVTGLAGTAFGVWLSKVLGGP